MEPLPPIPISALEHHEYCPRQCALIHADGIWADNAHTVRGTSGHRRVDSASSRLERDRRVLRSVPLWSESLGLTGRSDVVEVAPDGRLTPVEYKTGVRHGRTADLQVCAQAICLEEMTGQSIETGVLWYANARRRVRVDLDPDLRAMVGRVVAEIRAVLKSGHLPTAVDDERCPECQLLDVCIPTLSSRTGPARVEAYWSEEVMRCDC